MKMNKIHYYLSNGLWEVVKCHLPSDQLGNVPLTYLWGAAVAPHHACFASHVLSTPWQQCWMTIKLLQSCGDSLHSVQDFRAVLQEVDFQYILREYVADDSVTKLFDYFGKKIVTSVISLSENEAEFIMEDLLGRILRTCPSSAHSITRSLKDVLNYECDATAEFLLMLIASIAESPQLAIAKRLALTSYQKEMFILLFANDFGSVTKSLEVERQQQAAESLLADLEQLVHTGMQPQLLFETLLLTNRHFVLHLLDLLEMNPTLLELETRHIPYFLWPLLLLSLWGKPGISEPQIQSLIQQCKESTTDHTLIRVCFILDWYLSFSRWSESHGAEKLMTLESARNHSLLHLIHASADLAECDWDQVRSLLHEPWDHHLLAAFCSIILLLRAMLAAAEMFRERVRLGNAAETELRLDELYYSEVTSRLEEIRKLIASITPTRFRLEVLENLFAVLFITYEDLSKMSPKPFMHPNSKILTGRGFLCTANIMRDTVNFLIDCAAHLEADNIPESEIQLPCSIRCTQFENRLDRLSESLSEAVWRLQLVTGRDFASDIDSWNYSLDRHHFQSEWLVEGGAGQEVVKGKRRSCVEKKEESGSQSAASTCDSDRQNRQGDRCSGSAPAFMNHMLASDWTLVVRSLLQDDLLNAQHIITMMNTEESRQVLEGELNFTRAESEVRRRLMSIGDSGNKLEELVSTPIKQTSLQAVQQVAANAVNASALTNHIELFLSATTLPVIQGCSKVAAGSVLQCIDNCAATTTLDLAMTAAATHQHFRELLNVAGKHCPQLTSRLQSQMTVALTSKPVGYIAFAQTLMVLLHHLNKDVEFSPSRFFRTRYASFSLKFLNDQEVMWNTLSAMEREVVLSRVESESIGTDVVKAQKNVKLMQRNLENIIKVTDNAAECLDLGRTESGSNEMARHVNYSDLLNRYLSDLATLSVDSVPMNAVVDKVITFHSLLQQSAVEVLDKLVFQYKVDPALLEKKTQQLGFNLSASLLSGCAPAVPQGDGLLTPEIHLVPQCIILNASFTDAYRHEATSDIESTVHSILSDLLTALKEFARVTNGCCEQFLSSESLKLAFNDPAVKSQLQRAECLKYIHGVHLGANEIFPFYINLANLMTLHCVLDPTASAAFCSVDDLVFETAIRFCGYDVGGDFVSVGQLQSVVCGGDLFKLFSNRPMSTFDGTDPDPRTIFLLPLLQRINPGTRLEIATSELPCIQLSRAIEGFARRHIVLENDVIRIPALLDWYLDTVLLLQLPERTINGSSPKPSRRLHELLHFLMENSSSHEWQNCLKAWSSLDLTVEVIERIKHPSIALDYCSHAHAPNKLANTAELDFSAARPRWETRTLSEPILKQLNQSSRVLTDLVVRLHDAKNEGDGRNLEVGHDVLLDERLRCLDAQLSAWWLPGISPLFNNNTVLAALHKAPSLSVLWHYLNAHIVEKAWRDCWSVLRYLPDFIVLSDAYLSRVRDLVLFELSSSMSQGGEPGWIYAQKIYDVNLKLDCIILNSLYWPGVVAIKLYRDFLCDEKCVTDATRSIIYRKIRSIQVYSNICDNCNEFEGKSWYYVSSLSASHPATLLDTLLRSDQISIFFDWIDLDDVIKWIEPYIDASLIVRLATVLPRKLAKLSHCLSETKVQQLCNEAMPLLTSLTALRSVTELALKVCADDADGKYKMTWLGIELLSALENDIQTRLVQLAPQPLLIIEELVMNTCLHSLKLILNKLRTLDASGLITESEVADLLTQYGSRAVHLDVIRVVKASTRQTFFVPPSTDFVVPPNVPEQNEWVPDNQVSVCMCCRMVTFSMFNRRHHCRRCGRVVCASCSANRMKVDGFKDVLVRVCLSCFTKQCKPEADMAVNIAEDWIDVDEGSCTDTHYWTLSLDETHNATVRAEFAYHDAPNSALCLAIFNLVPDSPQYTSRLLDESEKLLELLQGRDATVNPEIDYPVLIQIIRSLVVGAKVRYGNTGLTTGVVSCDRLLSQVDVINLLVKSHCTRLIPPEPLNSSTMRTLRDRLVEEELWDIAVELSTKAGLSLTGVWAAWGKTLLAAGCWQEARSKFTQCLIPLSQHNRSSPLLDEICQIIDSTTFCTLRDSHSEVMELLNSLKTVANGKTPLVNASARMPQYSEQEWYLTRFGNSASLIKLYLRKEKWSTAISYIMQKQLDADFFNEYVLLPAYKNTNTHAFKAALEAIDPTLENCKRYLTAGCSYLEKNKYLTYLHDLQVFMHDFIRATMTCIQLYQSSGNNFSQLVQVSHLLHNATRHLEEELSAINKKTTRLENVMRLEHKEIVRHLNTIWRQLETSKFLAGCEELGIPIASLLMKLSWPHPLMPTLFDGVTTRCIIAALCVVAGKNVEEGFGLCYRIIQDSGLDMVEVMGKVGMLLGSYGRGTDLEKLAECIRTSGTEDFAFICDQILSLSISAMATHDNMNNFENLLPLLSNVDMKVKALLDARQLKSAYLLAVKFNKFSLIQQIMEEAERTGQTVIRDICRKKMGLSSDTSSLSSSVASTSSQ